MSGTLPSPRRSRKCSSGKRFSPHEGKGAKGIFPKLKMPFSPFLWEKPFYAEHGPSEHREARILDVR